MSYQDWFKNKFAWVKSGGMAADLAGIGGVISTTDVITGRTVFSASGDVMPIQTGYRTVLFGDSMMDTIDTPVAPTSASYSPSTGLLTIVSTGHQQAVGWPIAYWNRNYSSTEYFIDTTVTSVVDANTFVINIGANLNGVPSGTLATGGTFYRPKSWKSAESLINWLLMQSGQVFNLVYNGAQSGDQTADCLARIQTYCLSKSPDVVFCQLPGINDIAHGVPTETIWTNQKSIIDQLCEKVSRVVFLTMTPVASGESRASLPNMARVVRLNRRAKNYIAGKPNAILFDAYRYAVNPTTTSGYADTTIVRTTDKIHYSMNGGQRLSSALWNLIAPQFSSTFSTLPNSHIDSWQTGSVAISSASSDGASNSVITLNATGHGLLAGEIIKLGGGSPALNAILPVSTASTNSFTVIYPNQIAAGAITGTIYAGPCNNLFDNPVLATATGGTVVAPVTGIAANHIKIQNTTGSPTVVASVTARADGIGNDQQIVVTAAAASNQVVMEADYSLAVTLLPTIVAAGRSYVFEGMLSLSGVVGSNLTEIRPVISATVGGVTYQAYAMNGYANGSCLTQDVTDIHFRTAPMILPAGTVTNFKWQLVTTYSGAGTSLTIKLGKISLFELDAA